MTHGGGAEKIRVRGKEQRELVEKQWTKHLVQFCHCVNKLWDSLRLGIICKTWVLPGTSPSPLTGCQGYCHLPHLPASLVVVN